MAFRDDDRAQAIQIGAVLLFAVLIIAFSLHQAFVVPNQNEKVEFSHSADVQSDMQELRTGIHATVGGNPGRAATVRLGTQYPSRLVAVNPPPPSGQLRTVGTTNPLVNMTVVNATTDGETGDFWNGEPRPYNTGGIVYSPDYNEYGQPPRTIYENSLVYNDFGDETLSLAGQSLVSGDRISIVTLNGSFDRSGSHSATVDPDAISTSERQIAVDDGEGPITLNVTTRLSPDRWKTLLSDEPNVETDDIRPAPDADDVPDPFTRVLIPLNASEDYTLRMTNVGVGTGTTEESAEYLTDVSISDESVTEGENTTVVLEARDAYNNPKSGVTVNGSAGEGSIHPSSATTDSDGQVTFTYDSTDASGSTDLEFGLDPIGTGFDASTPENVSVPVEVTLPPSTDGGGGPFDLEWIKPDTANFTDDFNLTKDPNDNEWKFVVNASTDEESVSDLTVDFAANDSDVLLDPTRNTTDSSGNATVNFSADENKTVKLWATGGGGSDLVNVTVINATSGNTTTNDRPAAEFTYSPDSPTEGDTVDFDASGSNDPDGTITSYEWDWDGDGNYEGSGETTSHTFNSPGNYDVALRVTDDDGATATTTQTISVNARPTAEFAYSPDPPTEGESATFDASGSSDDGTITSYEWDWDDDGTYEGSGQTTNHTFNSPGEYDVTLRVTDDDGATATTTQTVSVNARPTGEFTYSPDPPTEGESVDFNGSGSSDSDGTITSYEWDWDGDGTYEGSGETPSHTFNTPGNYSVTLRVTDDDGATATTTQTVTVKQSVTIDVRVDDLTNLGQDQPRLLGSYAVANTNSSFTRVDISFDNQEDSSADQTIQSSSQRGGVEYFNTYGATDTYEITFDVVYTINGSESVVKSQTVTDTADAQNPTGNTDLSTSSSAAFTSWTIEDRSNPGQGARYDFTYQVDGGSFNEVKLGLLRTSGSIGDPGGSEVQTETTRSSNGAITLNPPSGNGEQYRAVIVVRDADGAVVDLADVADTADDSGDFEGP